MEKKLKASFELYNHEVNGDSLKYGFDKCSLDIAKAYIENFQSHPNANVRDFANHIRDEIIFDVWNTTNDHIPFTNQDDIDYWKALKEQGRSKIYATYTFNI